MESTSFDTRNQLLADFLREESHTSGDHFMRSAEHLERLNAKLILLRDAAENAVNAFSNFGLADLDEANDLHQAIQASRF